MKSRISAWAYHFVDMDVFWQMGASVVRAWLTAPSLKTRVAKMYSSAAKLCTARFATFADLDLSKEVKHLGEFGYAYQHTHVIRDAWREQMGEK